MPRLAKKATSAQLTGVSKAIDKLTLTDIRSLDCKEVVLHTLDKDTTTLKHVFKQLKCPYTEVGDNKFVVPLGNSWKGLVQLLTSVWVCTNKFSNIIRSLTSHNDINSCALIQHIRVDTDDGLISQSMKAGDHLERLQVPSSKGRYYICSSYRDKAIYEILSAILPLVQMNPKSSMVSLKPIEATSQRYKVKALELPGKKLAYFASLEKTQELPLIVGTGAMQQLIGRSYIAHPSHSPVKAKQFIGERIYPSFNPKHLAYPLVWDYHFILSFYFPMYKDKIQEYSHWALADFDHGLFTFSYMANYLESGHNFIVIDLDAI